MNTMAISALSPRGKILAALALALFAVAGNYFGLPLFFGVDFIFGSVAVMLAVALLGTLPAVLVAIAGGLYTVVLWGHPYALLIFTLEALVVSVLHRRGLRNLVLADLVYWLVVGVPLVLLFYRGMIGMAWEPTTLIALKQPLNGLFNALLAGLALIIAQSIRRGASLWLSGRPCLGELLFYALLSLALLAGATPILYASYAQRDEQEAFMAERLDERATQLVARIRSDLGDGRHRYEYHLTRVQTDPTIGLALLGANETLLAVRGEVSSLSTTDGGISELTNGLHIWLPGGDMAAMQRWKQGRYLVSLPVSGVPDVTRVVVERPAAPLVQTLERQRITLFLFLAGIVLLAVGASGWLSRWIGRPLAELEKAGGALTAQIADGVHPTLPDSPVHEYASLGHILREMSAHLADGFRALHQARAELESQVEARTAELNRFKSTLDRTLDCVFMFDAEWLRFFYANEGALQQVGYSRDELLTMHPYEIKPEIDEPQFRALIEPLLSGVRASLTFETVHQHKNGQRLPVEIFLQYMAPVGEPARFVAIVRDISERKAAEQALRESEQRFRETAKQLTLAAKAAQLGIWDLNLADGRLDWDAGMFRIYGMTEQDFGHTVDDWSRALLPECLEQATADFEYSVLHPETPFNSDFRIRRGDGEIRHIRAMAQAVPGREGRAERVIGINEDITDRKRAETALAEQARHTQAILDNILDGIVTIDRDGIVQSFNPAAERIFAYAADEVLGRNVSMLMPSPHREAHDGYLRDYQATGVARIIGIGREVEGQRKDGSLFPMELAVSEIAQRGQPLYVGMVRDISERKRMERMKSEFVSTVSHELRTPLTSISGALGLIAGGALGELPAQARGMIDIAHKNSQRLTHLINDLLDMEKIAAGKLHFEMQAQPLMPLIEQALDSHRTYGAERQVELVLEDGVTDVEVRVDGQRLQQVLANLLSNAIKFSPVGGVVHISVHALPDRVRVAVTDHGPGIPVAFRARVFEKFSQADSSDTRKEGGTGLGLAITRELVERMGGRIGFESVESEGATFWFELPSGAQGQASVHADDARTRALSDAPRILVVEDEPDAAALLAALLIHSGYEVDLAYTGEQALAALRQKAYDAMSLDLMLPDVSGLEIIRRIRERPETAGLPVVVVSAKMEQGRLAINGDFYGIEWLAKPIDEQRLLGTVETLLAASTHAYPRVLHVEDNADLHQVIRTMVRGRFDFELATSLREAREMVALERFEVVLLDISLPDGSGWDLLPEIRACQPEARVVILAGTDMTAAEAHRVEAVLTKAQVSPRELLDALSARIHRPFRRSRP